jgi:hypothetical protein
MIVRRRLAFLIAPELAAFIADAAETGDLALMHVLEAVDAIERARDEYDAGANDGIRGDLDEALAELEHAKRWLTDPPPSPPRGPSSSASASSSSRIGR